MLVHFMHIIMIGDGWAKRSWNAYFYNTITYENLLCECV